MENGKYSINVEDQKVTSVFIDEETIEFARLNTATRKHRNEIETKNSELAKAYRNQNRKYQVQKTKLFKVIFESVAMTTIFTIMWLFGLTAGLVPTIVASFGVARIAYHIGKFERFTKRRTRYGK